MMAQPRKAIKWQKVHVFISSTFNDMHAERDYLVKKVFPELQEWCERRKLRLVDIDLRWGVTEQDATYNRNVVKVCLERIDDCRPFFLCFLGQRRGWVPHEDEVSPDTYSRFPELRNYIDHSSITELEILHALINPLHRGIKYNPKQRDEKYVKAQHSFFYLRDSSYLDTLPTAPPQLRETYTNEGIEDPVERKHHDQELQKWRDDFKDKGCHYTAKWNEQATTPEIILPLSSPSTESRNISRWQKQWAKAGIEVKSTHIEEDPDLAEKAWKFNELLCRGRLSDFNSSGKELKDIILQDLKRAIAARYPDHVEHVEESELQKELDQQEEFLYINSEGFIERESAFVELDHYLADDSKQLFVLTAAGGMGKSMLLANWIDRWKDRPGTNQTLHFRFVGQSDRSTTLPNLLRSLLLELQQIAGKIPATIMETVKDPGGNDITREVPFNLPHDPIMLQSLWQEQLGQIGKYGKTVIVIDAINQFDTGLKDLYWLPLYGLPANIKFVVSIKEEAAGAPELLAKLAANQEHIRLARVKPFADLNDRRLLVNAYLSNYLKEIDARLLDEIIALKGAENPLFLKVVLSELRVFGSFASLADKIRSDFGDSPVSAFNGTLRRLESDPAYSAIPSGNAVPLLFGLMALARYGLSAEELAGMFRQFLTLGETAEQKVMALETVHLFLRQVRPFLARRDGRFDFFYESFKIAALERYIKRSSAEPVPKRTAQEWQQILARYFSSLPLWENKEQNKPQRRKVAELPYHQTRGEMWEEVKKTLCDLCFVEAKCVAGQVFELQFDYRLALDNLPERQAEIQAELERQKFIQRWTTELIAGAKSYNEGRELLTSSEVGAESEPLWSDPPSSCRMWTQDEIDLECRRILENPTDLDTLNTFAAFIRAECYSLLQFGQRPGFVLQHAWSYAPGGPVHQAAGMVLPGCQSPVLLRRWPTNARYNPIPVLLSTLEGHSNHVQSVAVTPDGRLAVSGSFDHTLRVWDLASGQCLRTLKGHSENIESMAMTPDGHLAISGSSDYTLRVWDLTNGQCLRTMKDAWTKSVAMTPDGRLAVSGDDGIQVWDLQSGQCLRTLSDPGFDVECIAMTPDGRRAIAGCSDKTLRVWDLQSGQCLFTLSGHNESVKSVAVTPDGRRAVSGSSDYTLRVWDLTNGQCLHTLAGHRGAVMSVAMTPDGRRAVSAGSKDNTLRVWDLQSGQCLRTLEGHHRKVGSVAVTADGRRAVSGSSDQTLRIWDLVSGQCLSTLEGHRNRLDRNDITEIKKSSKIVFLGHMDNVDSLVVTPDGRWAVSGGWDNTLQVWNLASGQCLHTLEGHSGAIMCIVVTPDGQRAVSGSWDETLRVWDLENGHCLHILEGHERQVWSVAITPDGRRAVSGSFDQTLRIWDLVSGQCWRSLQGHLGEVLNVVLTPDGRRAISGSSDRTLRVWDLKKGQCLLILQSHQGEVWSVAITPDGRRAISGSGDKTVRVWDLQNGQCLCTLKGHMDKVWMVVLTPDGRRAISGSWDQTLRVWDLASGQCLHTLEGHRNFITCVAVTADGLHVISASSDKTIRVWDLQSGQCLSLFSVTEEVSKIALAGRGNCICVGTQGGTVLFLEIQGLKPGSAMNSDLSDDPFAQTSKPWWKLW